MATRTFSATIDNTWELAGNWDTAPIAGDDCIVNATCVASTDLSGTVYASLTVNAGKTLTIANGGYLSFSTTASTLRGLTVQTGGTIQFANMTATVPAGQTLTMDGGTVNVVRSTATTSLTINGSITTTANGGTININTNSTTAGFVTPGADSTISGYSAAVRLLIDATVGSTKGRCLSAVGDRAVLQYVALKSGAGGFCLVNAGHFPRLLDSLVYGTAGALPTGISGAVPIIIRDCYIYYCTDGLLNLTAGHAVNCVFGQDSLGNAAANTNDVRRLNGKFYLHNCLLASAIEHVAGGGFGGTLVSTSHDQVKGAWKVWIPNTSTDANVVESETTVVRTAGRAIKFTSTSNTSATEGLRVRWPIALWPAIHGDTLAVTLWVRCTAAGSKIKVIVGPDGIYGTAQQVELTATNADTWYQATVPTFTVATSAGTKSVIPIVVQIEEASKTWYADDLSVSVNGQLERKQPMDHGAYDGVLPIESIGADVGGVRGIGFEAVGVIL